MLVFVLSLMLVELDLLELVDWVESEIPALSRMPLDEGAPRVRLVPDLLFDFRSELGP